MKQNIINKIAQDRMVETIVANVAKDTTDEDLTDLCQDIYLALMEKDEETIEDLYTKKQLNYYVTRMVINNIDSSTSRYFYNYKKNKLKQISMDDYKETAD
jgi:hypothetical protein